MWDVWVDRARWQSAQGLNERWARGEMMQGQMERRKQREVGRREWVIDGAVGGWRGGGRDGTLENRSCKQQAKNRVQMWREKKQVREAEITTTDGDRGEELKRSSERWEGGVLQTAQRGKKNEQNHPESHIWFSNRTVKSRFPSGRTVVSPQTAEDRCSCVLVLAADGKEPNKLKHHFNTLQPILNYYYWKYYWLIFC